MKITTWNINGIRAAIQKDVFSWISKNNADVVCLQEIKAKEEQIDKDVIKSSGYECICNPAERPGYSGVATLYKKEPLNIQFGMDIDKFDSEGRIIRTDYKDIKLFNIYFPNGGRGADRVQYKLDFYAHLLEICDRLHKNGENIILTGDFNTAHEAIDLKKPKENEKNSGFLPEERVWITKYLEHGFIDVYRKLYPDREQYTWWTYLYKARDRGIGWRIDYFLLSESMLDMVNDIVIHDEVMGSDHCPVTIFLKDN